jgi:hypothetical protein
MCAHGTMPAACNDLQLVAQVPRNCHGIDFLLPVRYNKTNGVQRASLLVMPSYKACT